MTSKGLHCSGAGASACQPIFSQPLTFGATIRNIIRCNPVGVGNGICSLKRERGDNDLLVLNRFDNHLSIDILLEQPLPAGTHGREHCNRRERHHSRGEPS
jgi:hypothetical protein